MDKSFATYLKFISSALLAHRLTKVASKTSKQQSNECFSIFKVLSLNILIVQSNRIRKSVKLKVYFLIQET